MRGHWRARWPRGFAELRGLHPVHVCAHYRRVNCLEWGDLARFGHPERAPYLTRYLYPMFARTIYRIDSDRETFLD